MQRFWKKLKHLPKRQQALSGLFLAAFICGLGILIWAAITGKIRPFALGNTEISNTAYVTHDGLTSRIASNTVKVTVDNPPAPPTSLTATAISSTQIDLRWTASTDTDIASYNLYRNNTLVKTGITGTAYSDTGLASSTAYSYQMTATDNGGLESDVKSNIANATTTSGGTDSNLIEAESMTLSNYAPEPFSWASGGNVIKISGAGLTGTATKNYSGTTGTYDIKVYYHDESDGQSTYKLYVGTTLVDEWTANQNLGITDVQLANQVVRTKTGVNVANGAAIKLEVVQNSNEWGRVDKIELAASTADTQAPSVPQGLTGSAASETEINLSWSGSTDNIGVTGYKVYRNNTQIGTSVTTTYVNTGLTANTAYSYQVSAYDAAGNESAKSSAVSVTTQSSGNANLIEAESMTLSNYAPEPFSWASGGNVIKISGAGLTGTATKNYTGTTGTYDLKVYYNEESDGASSYKLYVGTNVVDQWVADQNSNITDVRLENRVVRTKAGVSVANSAAIKLEVVQNSNEWGRVDKIELVPGTADTQAPSVPQGLTGSAVSPTQINLSWTASQDNVGVTGYYIYRGGVRVGGSTSTTYPNTNLSPSTTYNYEVSAFDAAGNESARSSTVTVTTSGVTDNPPTVNITAPTNGATVSGTTSISANASDDNSISKVDIYIDGVLKVSESASPYTYSWNTSSYSNGSHTVMARAYDTINQYTDHQITVSVNNTSTQLTISNVSVASHAKSADIGWTTNLPSDSRICYGLTTSYATCTPLNSASVNSHSITINGLGKRTNYYYKIYSSAGGSTATYTGTFQTRG